MLASKSRKLLPRLVTKERHKVEIQALALLGNVFAVLLNQFVQVLRGSILEAQHELPVQVFVLNTWPVAISVISLAS